MSYCYGLSVIHSHLLRGAGIILTDHSVVDDEFWELFRRHRGTAFAGVPYTFELLDRIGFDAMDFPDLRYVTQAGGRLAPERVRRFAELGQRQGLGAVRDVRRDGGDRPNGLSATGTRDLPSEHSIGRPIPGGSFTIEPVDEWGDDAVGELVYRGPNVMMGYAHGPADLALGKTVDTLHTGDIARRGPDGLYEVHRPQQPLRQVVRAADRPAAARDHAARARRHGVLHRRRRSPRGRGHGGHDERRRATARRRSRRCYPPPRSWP